MLLIRARGVHFEQRPLVSSEDLAGHALANCLQQLDDVPGAMRHYRLAAESAIWTEQASSRNEALLQAGKMAVQMKLSKLAQRYLGELLRVDPNHREAAQLMQSA